LLKAVRIEAELAKSRWNKADSKETAPNVLAIIERFNLISYWVATEIVTSSSQGATIKKLISVAQECRASNNFHSLMAILAGMNSCSVSRLDSFKVSLLPYNISTLIPLSRIFQKVEKIPSK